MHYFYQPDIKAGKHFLDEEESKHCTRVLRHRKGDRVQVLDGKGGHYLVELTGDNPRKTTFRILETHQEDQPAWTIHLAIAPTKNMDRIEWLLEKTTELGINRISFLISEHSERKKLNMDRLKKKMISAIKQSGNRFLPELEPPCPFAGFMETLPTDEQMFIANAEMGRSKDLKSLSVPGKSSLIMIGPEGDFTDEELKAAIKNGCQPVSLGPTRLRTETAGLVACVQLQLINL